MKYTRSGGRSAVGCAHVRFSPGARTATPDGFMAHVTMQEADGRVVTWLDHVTDDEYAVR